MHDLGLLNISELFDYFGLLVLFVEILWLLVWRRVTGARLREVFANASVAVPFFIANTLFAGFSFAVLFIGASFVPWALPVNIGTALLALLLADFTYYWEHRLSHVIRGWWALSHSVHHSSDHFDQTTGFRLSFVDVFITPFTLLPALLTGISPILLITASVLVLSYQGWLHTEMIGKLGWFDRIFNTPSNHRVHHASDPIYIDKNFGGILIIWDRLFGTWQPELHTPTYGITHQVRSANPWTVHTAELQRLIADMRAAPSWGKALAIALGPTSGGG